MIGTGHPTFGAPIKLTLSGGGYRASAFHLGTLSYLNRIGLLEEVDTLSTVSGGTITGMSYALSLKNAIPFDTFFGSLYRFLAASNMLELSLDIIGKRSPHTRSKDHNLITSFAEIYDRRLTGGVRFGLFWGGRPIHLKEIIFNATEFRTGLAFRFQKSENPKAVIGNLRNPLLRKFAKDLRMADILAASSCFPGGCEPIAFPEDFAWPDHGIPPEIKALFPRPLPLMDGGVYDNQGIESAILADERSGNRIGLFIISDVDPPDENIYTFPHDRKRGRITIGVLYAAYLVSVALLFLSSLALALRLGLSVEHHGFSPLWDVLTGIIPAALSAGIGGSMLWLRRLVRQRAEAFGSETGSRAWRNIRRLTTAQFLDMMELRVTSLITLTSEVFMKRIRRLIYASVYSNRDYDNKRVSNLIYSTLRSGDKNIPHWLIPSPAVVETAGRAVAMETTLWFTRESDLRDITACGQFTMCYNLLEFILRDAKRRGKAPSGKIRDIFDRAREDWERFKERPHWMVDEAAAGGTVQ